MCNTTVTVDPERYTYIYINNGEAVIWSAEEEEEEGERRGCRTGESGGGAFKAWADQVVDGLVLHHKDVFVSHVLPKLNRTDRFFFSEVNRESSGCVCVRRGKPIGIKNSCL